LSEEEDLAAEAAAAFARDPSADAETTAASFFDDGARDFLGALGVAGRNDHGAPRGHRPAL
jgi:hypothetical protein